jgi:hypothetical protein
MAPRIFSLQRIDHAKSRPGESPGAARGRWLTSSVLRVPEDHVAAFLAFDRRKVCVDLAGSDLRVCEGDRDVFAARCFRFPEPAAADFGRGFTGEDAVVRLSFGAFFRVLLDADRADRFIIARAPSKPVLVSLTYPSALAMWEFLSFLLVVPETPCPRRRRTARTARRRPEPVRGAAQRSTGPQENFAREECAEAQGKILRKGRFRGGPASSRSHGKRREQGVRRRVRGKRKTLSWPTTVGCKASPRDGRFFCPSPG